MKNIIKKLTITAFILSLLFSFGLSFAQEATTTNISMVWTAKTNAGKRNWKAITSSSDGNQLAAIENYGENIYISKDKGNTWELKSFPVQHWSDINSSPDGKYVIASGKNYIYLSSDFGATWSSLNNPPEVDYWHNISLSDDGKTIGTIVRY